MATLNQKELLGLLLRAIDASGWQGIFLDAKKPFRIRLFRNDDKGFNVCIYIWNCTHGGGKARADDEYRIQFTGSMPKLHSDGVTLLLGWHEGYGVFAAWDMTKHNGQVSKSPSAQVKEAALSNAHTHAFSIHQRNNGEIVVAFRPELLVDYTLNEATLHETGETGTDLSLLNALETLTDERIDLVPNKDRKTVISQISRKYRAQDFRRRVLGAYEHRCAMCAVQLELIDAAHIIPVAVAISTDETTNGIALCKLHHTAFDRNLVSFDEHYKIEVNGQEVERLVNENRAGGLTAFRRHLKTAIILPSDKRDYPSGAYIREARAVRNWAT